MLPPTQPETIATITLQRATPEQKPTLRQLLELYQYDFSEYTQADVDENGGYGYAYLDHYWVEPGRHPILIKADGRLAGFALVCTFPASPKGIFSVHELTAFFILKKYRRRGVGSAAANRLFTMFLGEWQVKHPTGNLPARAFWRRIIGQFTGCNYQESLDHERGEVRQQFLSLNSY